MQSSDSSDVKMSIYLLLTLPGNTSTQSCWWRRTMKIRFSGSTSLKSHIFLLLILILMMPNVWEVSMMSFSCRVNLYLWIVSWWSVSDYWSAFSTQQCASEIAYTPSQSADSPLFLTANLNTLGCSVLMVLLRYATPTPHWLESLWMVVPELKNMMLSLVFSLKESWMTSVMSF